MTLRLFNDLFFRPATRVLVIPATRQVEPSFARWGCVRRSEPESEFADFVRGVDGRFSGLFAKVPSDVTVEHADDIGEAAESDKKFELRLAVQDFQPDDIKVKVQGNNVIVEAKREEKKEEDGMYAHSYREFKRSFPIPEGVDKKQLTSALSSGGVLEIEAPLLAAIEEPKPEEKQEVKVTHEEEKED